MKKIIALVVVMLAVPAMAMAQGIVGECSDCHTMHNSEQGSAVAKVGLAGTISNIPNQNLLKYDCIACHAQGSADRIVGLTSGSQVPQVYHTDTTDLAAGNFGYIDGFKEGFETTFGDRKGHNVVDIVSADSTYATPPGFRHDENSVGGGGFALDEFTCAGYMGCHGFRGQKQYEIGISCDPTTGEKYINGEPTGEQCTAEEFGQHNYRTGLLALSGYDGYGDDAGVRKGAHHRNYDGLKKGGYQSDFYDHPLSHSYRFIRGAMGYGNEVDRWQNVGKGSHNEYVGGYLDNALGEMIKDTDFDTTENCKRCHTGGMGSTQSRITTPNMSISGFCVTCHGKFHSSGSAEGPNGVSGSFLRHPSDYVIPNRDEYAAYTSYDVTAPVARPHGTFLEGFMPSEKVTPGTDLVMCLSCHQAHASEHDGMLRFDYAGMVAGNFADTATAQEAGGCLACHTTKGMNKQQAAQ